MEKNNLIHISSKTKIHQNELVFTTSRSGKPGGQNVNKVNTQVSLSFDVVNSTSLSDKQKQLILEKLKTRISKDGRLIMVSHQFRSQSANRQDVIERFTDLLQTALKPRKSRKKTKIPKADKMKRLEDKRKHSRLKADRSKQIHQDNQD